MKRYLHLQLNRLRAAFMVLTSRRYVVISYKRPGDIAARYNVGLLAYRALCQVIDEAFEYQEGEESVVEQVEELLKNPKLPS